MNNDHGHGNQEGANDAWHPSRTWQALMRQEVAFFENNSSGALVSRCAKQKKPWKDAYEITLWHHRTSHFLLYFFNFSEFMNVKHSSCLQGCFWNCSIHSTHVLGLLQSWKLMFFFSLQVDQWYWSASKCQELISLFFMASSHQSISKFWVENIRVRHWKSRCCSYSNSLAFGMCWGFPGILKFEDSILWQMENDDRKGPSFPFLLKNLKKSPSNYFQYWKLR